MSFDVAFGKLTMRITLVLRHDGSLFSKYDVTRNTEFYVVFVTPREIRENIFTAFIRKRYLPWSEAGKLRLTSRYAVELVPTFFTVKGLTQKKLKLIEGTIGFKLLFHILLKLSGNGIIMIFGGIRQMTS